MNTSILVEQKDGIQIEVINNDVIDLELSNVVILGDYIQSDEKGSVNGVATLDEKGLIPKNQIPSTGISATNADIEKAIENLNAVTVGNIYW